MYGSPDEIARKLEALSNAGVRYILLNGAGAGGGERARQSLRQFAREVMPAFAERSELREVV
jgi:alkanesulfonate monooxygenase SsuD/methylene tetrahydromethanopterin reductase-like flavin-dependent oxidoreductase (luciferase family)